MNAPDNKQKSAHDKSMVTRHPDLREFVRNSLLACLLLLPVQAGAEGGAIYRPVTASGPAAAPDYYPVIYQAPVTDLSVKVWGGEIAIHRGIYDGGWYMNLNWMPLKVTYDSFDSSVKTVTRGYTEYSRVAPGVYQDKYYNTVRQTATGFRWNDPKATWIEYNPAGEIKAYGNRNGTIATFSYGGATSTTPVNGIPPSEGHITGVFDHYGTQVLWFDYDTSNHLIRIRDAANRKVEYQWTAASDHSSITLDVLDANGNAWKYAAVGLRPPAPVSAPALGGGGTGAEAAAAVRLTYPHRHLPTQPVNVSRY